MKLKLVFASLALAGLSFSHAEEKPADERPVVQLAILLDNSGSMNGLISQAKSQLWNIVNEFISAKQDGKAPRVQVALYEYGVNDLGEKKGYIRELSPLTEDLDKLSEQLFAINSRSSGSNEYCGWVIRDAVKELEWDKSSKTYKAIFIAGNEPFTQGQVDYRDACKGAIAKGIIVNTIHCGVEAEGVRGMWKEGAVLADGRFLNINHNAVAAAPPAPQDKEIADLNTKLNGTYLAWGALGEASRARQNVQDSNAAAAPAGPAVLSARVASKSSAVYNNATWDLVDRSKQEKDFDLGKMKDSDLPEEMRKMSPEERKEHLAKKTAERAELQKRIGDLVRDREKFIAEDAKKNTKDATLGTAVTSAVREQAAKKGVSFSDK
jgi:hypothetical protein